MRMLRTGLQLEQIDHIDETDLEVGELVPQQSGRRQRFLRGNVTGRRHHNVGFSTLVVAGPIPDTDALRAVPDCSVHVHVLQMHLLVGDDHVDVILAAQTMIGHGQERVDVRWKINSGYVGALVHHHIEKPGILVSEAVVILTPDGRGDQQVQRGDLSRQDK